MTTPLPAKPKQKKEANRKHVQPSSPSLNNRTQQTGSW